MKRLQFIFRVIVFGSVWTPIFSAMASTLDWHAWSSKGFEAKKSDSQTLVIKGIIGPGDYQKFKAAFEDKVKVVRVSGPGGAVSEAVKMGLDLRRNNVDVIVDGPCLSSCANYLFLAGKKKAIEQEGFVGFHGSPYHGALLKMGRKSLDAFIDSGKMNPETQKMIEKTRKKRPELTMQDIQKLLNGEFRDSMRDNREFFDKIGVSDRLINNSLHGRFVEQVPECHGLYPLSENEKENEPFYYPTAKQMSAFDVKDLSGKQNLKLAYELSTLVPTNRRDNNSVLFCVDAYDNEDWVNAVSEITGPVRAAVYGAGSERQSLK